MSIKLESKIEGVLFYKGEEVKIKELENLLKVSTNEVEQALIKLKENLNGRGIVLVRKDDSVILGITSELSSTIESIRKDEIDKDLSKASLETLSIILYKNGITRNEIDYIRGVNSSFILRSLLIRGLIEKVTDNRDARRLLYRPTVDILAYMGVNSINELPNYIDTVSKLEETLNQQEENE